MISMQATTPIYERVIRITAEYLGPAAPRFIDRQIEKHLGKQPSDLTTADMPVLIDWSRVALAFLTDDQKIVTNYVEDMYSLYHESR